MQLNIEHEKAGSRLDKVLSELTSYSRTLISELIKAQKIAVNGQAGKASYRVQAGDVIDLDEPEAEVLAILPENLPLEIVYEDADVAVINKAQGRVVHPSAGHLTGTLVNALMYHINDLSTINGVVRPGIVHRIDKDTSGLLMIAKNDQAHESLAQQLKEKTSKRRYLALVHGELENNQGTIDAPIGRNPKDRKKQAVVANGKAAVTHFEVLERFKGYTFIALELETGRTHQIRVHMAYIGHPLAGDPLYGPAKTLVPNAGQFLHAALLGFTHPRTGKWLEFETPLPPIFEKQLKRLREEN